MITILVSTPAYTVILFC